MRCEYALALSYLRRSSNVKGFRGEEASLETSSWATSVTPAGYDHDEMLLVEGDDDDDDV